MGYPLWGRTESDTEATWRQRLTWYDLVASQVFQDLPAGKDLPARQEMQIQSLSWEDTLEKAKATHSTILAWRIPWTVQTMGLRRVGHD